MKSGRGQRTDQSILYAHVWEGAACPKLVLVLKASKVAQGWTAADVLSFLRIPLAAAFVLVLDTPAGGSPSSGAAAVTDLLDGPWPGAGAARPTARCSIRSPTRCSWPRPSGVVAFSGRLEPYEIAGVLLRDIVATVAFVATFFSDQPRAIPARWSGKAVTVAQILTLVAFLLSSPYLRPIAWATTVIALRSPSGITCGWRPGPSGGWGDNAGDQAGNPDLAGGAAILRGRARGSAHGDRWR